MKLSISYNTNKKIKLMNKVEYLSGCQLKHSRVDKCMSKEQVAFKFHECPDGDEEDSRGSVTDIFISILWSECKKRLTKCCWWSPLLHPFVISFQI